MTGEMSFISLLPQKMYLETDLSFAYSKIMESFALALIDNIQDSALKIYLILFAALVVLFIILIKNRKLMVLHNICLLTILICALTLIFSKILDLQEQWYAILFQGKILKAYLITIVATSILLLLLIIVPGCYILISSKQTPLIRWKMLKNFPLWILTQNKKNTFLTHIVYTLTLLGASSKAAFYERQIKGFKKTDFYHLLKIERAFLQGNVSDQIKLADTAVTTCTKKTKPLYQHCFYINKAVGYFYQHDYRNADTNYKKAYSFIKNRKIKSLKLIFDFYRDFLINKVCLNASESEINTCLEEFESYINHRNPEHWMLYFDLQLAVLQQSRASTGAINSNIEASLKKFEELELKEHIRTAYIIKVARILTSCSGNPEHCIRMLTYKTKYLSKFSFCEKYSIYKDLYYLFTNLCGPILVCVPDLIEETERYFKHDATNEINVYLAKLPEEAIFDHIYYTQELAWLRRITDQNHDFALIKADLTSAIHLCEENSLISQAMTMRLNIADEALALHNIKPDGTSRYEKDIKEACNTVAKFVLKQQKSHFEAELDFRLAFYYLRIHDYKNHVIFFDRFLQTNHPAEFFAVWCRIYIRVCSFTSAILKTLETIQTASKSKQLTTASVNTRNFFNTYQKSTDETFPLILGLLMTPKFMPEFGIKRCTMSDSAKTYVHYWLVNPSLGIEIDPLYKNFTNDENTDRIFFILNGHPLQTKESITAKSMTSVKIEIKPSQLITLDKTFIAMYSEILELLQKELNKNS